MCIRMKHFSVYIASAGSVFTCGHLSPLVLPNTLANEAMVCFHCLRLLWWVSLYYFIHNFHSLPLKMFQLSSVWNVHVCVSHLLRNVLYLLFYIKMKSHTAKIYKQTGLHYALMLNSVSVL